MFSTSQKPARMALGKNVEQRTFTVYIRLLSNQTLIPTVSPGTVASFLNIQIQLKSPNPGNTGRETLKLPLRFRKCALWIALKGRNVTELSFLLWSLLMLLYSTDDLIRLVFIIL